MRADASSAAASALGSYETVEDWDLSWLQQQEPLSFMSTAALADLLACVTPSTLDAGQQTSVGGDELVIVREGVLVLGEDAHSARLRAHGWVLGAGC